MPSKSVTKTDTKSPKPTKSKVPISSEFIEDSEGDNDEPMVDAPPTKRPRAKITEKTSKKRNRDGTEKVNVSSAASSAPKKVVASESAVSAPKIQPKSVSNGTNGTKKSKKAVEVVESNADTSESESESSAEPSGKEPKSKSKSILSPSGSEGSKSESEGESGTSDKTPHLPTSLSTRLPLDTDIPPGFVPLDSTSSGSIPSSSLEEKHIFLFATPARFNFSDVRKIKLPTDLDEESIASKDTKFTIRRVENSSSHGMKVLLPREGKKGYQLAPVITNAQYIITEEPPSMRTKKPTTNLQPRAQPEGLRMRFMPAGYGEESDLHVNKTVLPPLDMKSNYMSDEDVAMEDVDVVVETPIHKKSQKKEGKRVEEPTPTKEKEKTKAPDGGILAADYEDSPENIRAEEKRAKKEKKKKKSEHKDEDEKKEKKKRKKDKTAAEA